VGLEVVIPQRGELVVYMLVRLLVLLADERSALVPVDHWHRSLRTRLDRREGDASNVEQRCPRALANYVIRSLFDLRSADVIVQDLPINENWQDKSPERPTTKQASNMSRVLVILRQNPVLLFVRQVVDYDQFFLYNCRHSMIPVLQKTKAIAFRSLSFDVDAAVSVGELFDERAREIEDLITGASLLRLAPLSVEIVAILLLGQVLKGMLRARIYFSTRLWCACCGAIHQHE